MGEKRIKGRKRHIVVDTMGNPLAVEIHDANIHDTKSGIVVTGKALPSCPTIRSFCGDAGYKGAFEDDLWEGFSMGVDISERISGCGWKVLPKRWIVERTFSWLNHYRVLIGIMRLQKALLKRW